MGSFIGRRTQNQEMLSGFANLAWENFWSWYEALRDGDGAQWTFSQKKAINPFFCRIANIWNEEMLIFFNSFVIWRCNDDCKKVISSHYFFCVFVNRFFQRKSFLFNSTQLCMKSTWLLVLFLVEIIQFVAFLSLPSPLCRAPVHSILG